MRNHNSNRNYKIAPLTPLFFSATAKKISIAATYQSTDTNRTRMEHLSLLEVTIGSKKLNMGSARLGDNIIKESNQAITSIYIRGHSYQDFPSGIWKSVTEISVDFE